MIVCLGCQSDSIKTLSFSKKLDNHIGAIKYFICHYNEHLALLI
jgi:hypothetical protein